LAVDFLIVSSAFVESCHYITDSKLPDLSYPINDKEPLLHQVRHNFSTLIIRTSNHKRSFAG